MTYPVKRFVRNGQINEFVVSNTVSCPVSQTL